MIRGLLQKLSFVAICLVAGQKAATASMPDCMALARAAEGLHGLPNGILQSISRIEASRIQSDGSYKAWPWTLNDSGKGLFFDNREQVLDYLDTHMTNPDTSIDIGCMQINTKWHGSFFETLDEMLDPASNVAYAAGFLTDLYYAHGSWNEAIRHYHSSDRHKNGPYLKRVLATWTEHHPNAQDAQIQTAVFQLPLEPISTAADDAFARAMREAGANVTQKGVEPSPKPVALPVAKPVIKTTGAPSPVHPNKDLPTKTTGAVQASITPDGSPVASAQSAPEPVDPDLRVKQQQKNLLGQWDRVLMFRAQFAKMR